MRLAAISLWSSSLLQLKFLSTNIVQKIGSDNGNYRRQSVCRPFAVIRELIMLSDVRYWSAGSTGRCNTGVKSLRWGFELQGLTWSFIELTRHLIQISLRVHRQVGSLGKVPVSYT